MFKISLIFPILENEICQIIDIKKLKKKTLELSEFFWTIFLEDFFNKRNGKKFWKMCFLSLTTNLKPTHPKNKTRKRKKRVDLRSRYFEELGCGLGLGTWLLPFLSETGSQPDRQASSPPRSDELPVRRCCFLCPIRTKIKSFHGAPMSKQQEIDAPDVQVSLFSLRIYLPPPNLCGKCRWICMWFEKLGRAGLRKSFVRKIMHVVIGIFSLVVVTKVAP